MKSFWTFLHEIPVGHKNLPMLVAVGVALALAWKEHFGPATIGAALGVHWGNFTVRLIMLLFAMCVWPVVIRKSCEKSS